MLNTLKKSDFFVVILLAVFTASAWAADVKGSKDHPAAGRLTGSDILVYSSKNFDSYNIPLGQAKPGDNNNYTFPNSQKVEGTTTKITYIAPEGKSAEEVIANYRELFKSKSFETLFEAKDDDFGRYDEFVKAAKYEKVFESSGGARRFIAGKLAGQNGDVYISVYAAENNFWGFEIKIGKQEAKKGRTYYQVDVVETKPLTTSLVVMKAEEMEGSLSKTGRVALYGILFDHDKTDIKPESKPALEEIAKLLKASPDLKILVVGHTDNQGEIKYNQDLSKRRAESVVKALTSEYGIAGGRLSAHGVGMLSPVASNDSDDGKAKNRRVELVKQ
ncbi:OmpA family protein [Desulforegula conservatrix]|uniref:OmpA family protein n=1 Tax=Desulforegula conservatrix TaxID=153026 RepID=UPI000407C8A6|nr:OmpA family protein [Desulforegula conservatrix]